LKSSSVRLFLAAAALALGIPAPAQSVSTQSGKGPEIVFDYSNPGLSPSHWTLTFHPDGSGHFTSETNSKAGTTGDEMSLPNVNRDIQVSAKFAAGVFDAAQHEAWFNEDCDGHMKVAFQGAKKISYSGPEGNGSCTFNYSKNKVIQSLGDSMQAVAMTVMEGVRLEMLLQHDPLGLDKELVNLTNAAHEGRAQQISVISDILQRLAQDDHVMDMVRKQARMLLAQADS
jgi:hypothetical protein